MSPKITNPHVALDGEAPAGKLPGGVHASDEKDGVTWQCVACELVTTYPWRDVDDQAERYLAAHGDGVLDAVPLPACPGCGAVTFLNNSDVEYGLEMPHHYTRRVLDEHLLQRPKLKGRFAVNRHADRERWQGVDFSHKPKKDRPSQHRKLPKEQTGVENVDSGA